MPSSSSLTRVMLVPENQRKRVRLFSWAYQIFLWASLSVIAIHAWTSRDVPTVEGKLSHGSVTPDAVIPLAE